MILDYLRHASNYQCLGPRFTEAFNYLAKLDPATADGRYELDGDRVFSLVQSYQTTLPEERTFESHRRYADIQYLMSGREVIYYQEDRALEPKAPYDEKTDSTLYHPQDNRPIFLDSGSFTVFWPQDAHKPGCHWQEPSLVKKVVIKILLSN